MTETTDGKPAILQMSTVAAHRIAERLGDLTFVQLKAALTAAVSALDDEALEEVGSGGYFNGPALFTLNVIAEAAGLEPFKREDIEHEDDFFM
ncbi:hypothetical protein [Amycolatopsis sp. NPDC098790]|uniref:hypothetical protein n=1 Tax=Amycolatopsis sp. NPDC098790 TaxID=3363939 RepID=UPI00381EB49E